MGLSIVALVPEVMLTAGVYTSKDRFCVTWILRREYFVFIFEYVSFHRAIVLGFNEGSKRKGRLDENNIICMMRTLNWEQETENVG